MVSIPSREFGSSGPAKHPAGGQNPVGSFNPFQGIWEFRRINSANFFTGESCFNPFQGIWEFRHAQIIQRRHQRAKFQSLPGNLGVPARYWMMMVCSGPAFQSLPGNLGVPAWPPYDSPSPSTWFQSLPGNLGVPARHTANIFRS